LCLQTIAFQFKTNIYAEVDLKMKARDLACCEVEQKNTPTHWLDNKDPFVQGATQHNF
jgi:hypothetical protein